MSSPKSIYNSRQTKTDSLELERTSSVGGTLSSLAKDTGKATLDSFKDIGSGIFDQLLNSDHVKEAYPDFIRETEAEKKHVMNLEHGTLFSYRNIEEERQIGEIKELIQAIRQEVEQIKRADKTLMSEVKDIENITIASLPEKPGIYHIRFLEVVLKVLQSLKLKINESGTWMEALRSKKAKRGSAFAVQSKKKGTQYSMSQELSTARSVQ